MVAFLWEHFRRTFAYPFDGVTLLPAREGSSIPPLRSGRPKIGCRVRMTENSHLLFKMPVNTKRRYYFQISRSSER